MLRRGPYQQGVSMIELLIGLGVVAMLMAFGAPSMSTWIFNSQIRTTAEAIQNGLQIARAEAVRRNTPISFYLTNTTDNSCAVSVAGVSWVVSGANPAGKCGYAASDTVEPRIVQTRTSAEGSGNAAVAADQSSIQFNGLGRVAPVPAGTININISHATGGDCAAIGGTMRCLRVTVTPGGQVRMCDPALPSTEIRGC